MSLSGAGFIFCAAGTGLVSSLVLIPPALPLLYLSPALFHKYTNSVAACWFRLVVWLIEHVNGVKFVFTGDTMLDERALVMSNHRTRLDWMLLWSLFARVGSLDRLRIVLKAGLKTAPFFGFVMQTLGFLFLERDWEKDREHMKDMLSCYSNLPSGVQLLIFPEGSDLSASNLEKSKQFSKDKNKPVYEHLLHPRTKGYALCHDRLREDVDAVYDLTIGFPDKVPQSESTIFKGSWPAEIHIHASRIPCDQLPAGDPAVVAWVEQLFARKEQMLAKFAVEKKFDAPPVQYAPVSTLLRVTALLWSLLSGGWLFMIYRSSIVRWGSLLYVVAMFFAQRKVSQLGGVDKLEIGLLKTAAHSKRE